MNKISLAGRRAVPRRRQREGRDRTGPAAHAPAMAGNLESGRAPRPMAAPHGSTEEESDSRRLDQPASEDMPIAVAIGMLTGCRPVLRPRSELAVLSRVLVP